MTDAAPRLPPALAAQIEDMARAGLGHHAIARRLRIGTRRVLSHMAATGLQRQWLDQGRNQGCRHGQRPWARFSDEQLLALIERDPPLSISAIARRLGVSKTSVQLRLLRHLPEAWLRSRSRFKTGTGRPRIELQGEDRFCCMPGCRREADIKVRRLCNAHYQAWRKGRCMPPSAPAAAAVAAAPRPAQDRRRL